MRISIGVSIAVGDLAITQTGRIDDDAIDHTVVIPSAAIYEGIAHRTSVRAELGIFVPQGGTSDLFLLGVELRCSVAEIEEEDLSFKLGIKKAELCLLLADCNIPPGTRRYGDDHPQGCSTLAT